MARAQDGAAALAGFLTSLDAVVPQVQINVVAHSYGSTTAALAIGSRPDGLGVDRFIVLGSAGFPDDEAVLANLRSGPDIYATLSEGDGWARFGRATAIGHSVSPETLAGVTEFGSDGGYDADGNHLLATPGHAAHDGANSMLWDGGEVGNGYLQPDTESFYNIAQIIATGETGTELDGEGSETGFFEVMEQAYSNPYHPYYPY